MCLAQNIRYLRKKKNMSQDLLAEKLGYKSYTTIQKWESGVSEPPFKQLKIMAELFDVDMDDLAKVNLEYKNSNPDCTSMIQMSVSDREQSHILVYRDLSDTGKDRVDNYTNKVKLLEQNDSDSEIIEKFHEHFVARNGNKNLSPDQMRAIMDIIDNADD